MKRNPTGSSASDTPLAYNGLCLCNGEKTCVNCLFCLKHHTPSGRKALAATVAAFLIFTPVYQELLKKELEAVFPGSVIYEDEKDIASLLFEAVTFEAILDGYTPFAYFLFHAPLSEEQKRLYSAWQAYTRFGFFRIEKIIPQKEVYISDVLGGLTYKVYETSGTAHLQPGHILASRLVPFLDGFMFHTEKIISYARLNTEWIQKSQGVTIPQLVFVRRYYKDHQERIRSKEEKIEKNVVAIDKQVQLAQAIETFVRQIADNGGEDTELLQQSFTYLPTFKELLDTTTPEQMDSLCLTYPGFYRFAKLVESIAQGIQDGTIKVPTVH